ncbi:adenosine kinase [Prochlorothrix hollandica]|uniref:adenosine kinase n=1 Tax=Prochlorothrix hollandica TaxID=1223 RepID=UPI003340C364
MTQYHVYGLGNALVDIELSLTPEILAAVGIDKGVMTLLDEEQQQGILDRLQGHSFKKASGGSAANTLIALGQLGGQGFYACKVANDEDGLFYLYDLVNCGVATQLRADALEPGITGKCLVMVTPDADRTMGTFLGISGSFGEGDLSADAIAAADYTYIEGYLVSSPTGKGAAIAARQMAKAAGKQVSLTLSDFNMVKFFQDGLLEMIGDGVDLLFANETEALAMAGTEDLTAAIDHLKTLSRTFAITRGSDGSLVFDGDNLLEVAGYPVQAVDTVGAGDSYAGGFLYGLSQGWSYGKAGELASRLSSQLVTQYGPRLTTSQVQTILQAVAG